MFATASYIDAWPMVHRYIKSNCFLLEWKLKVNELWHLACAILMKLDEKGTKQLFQKWFTCNGWPLGTSGKIVGEPFYFQDIN